MSTVFYFSAEWYFKEIAYNTTGGASNQGAPNKLFSIARTYEWTEPSRGVGSQIGVIAQEVEEIFPEAVLTDNEGYKSVAYAKLVASQLSKDDKGLYAGMLPTGLNTVVISVESRGKTTQHAMSVTIREEAK